MRLIKYLGHSDGFVDRVDFGERIKVSRKALKISQRELAEKVGLSRPTIIALEKGRITRIPCDQMADLLRALKFWNV